jgi:hypothetical protein
MKHLDSVKPQCECAISRIEQVIDKTWECTRLECPHRHASVAPPQHAKRLGNGGYRVNPDLKDD